MASQPTTPSSSALERAGDVVRDRLTELDYQLEALTSERDALRKALDALSATGPSTTAVRSPRRRVPARTAKSATRGQGRRRRSGNREKVIGALGQTPKTAREIATETGLNRNSVATLLVRLVADGDATKADRGYRTS